MGCCCCLLRSSFHLYHDRIFLALYWSRTYIYFPICFHLYIIQSIHLSPFFFALLQVIVSLYIAFKTYYIICLFYLLENPNMDVSLKKKKNLNMCSGLKRSTKRLYMKLLKRLKQASLLFYKDFIINLDVILYHNLIKFLFEFPN